MANRTEKPGERTEQQRAQDAAYTINHAIACSVSDLGAPIISHGVARKFFHSHSSLWQWFASEGIGDVAAVPVTLAIERAAPGVTQSLRGGMEKALGWAFRKSAHREAQAWARKNGVAGDSADAKTKEQQIYSYEIEHLPQAAIWTATSMVFNVATQKAFHTRHEHGHDHGHSHGHTALEITGALIAGKAVSTAAVIGFRAAFPEKAHEWDSLAGRKVFEPLARGAGSLLGRKPGADSWETRVADGQPAAATAR